VNAKDLSGTITLIEQKEDLLGVESAAKGVYYFVDKNKKGPKLGRIRITTSRDSELKSIELSFIQAKALISEIKDVCELQWGAYINEKEKEQG
jgi:hypothetical protein